MTYSFKEFLNEKKLENLQAMAEMALYYGDMERQQSSHVNSTHNVKLMKDTKGNDLYYVKFPDEFEYDNPTDPTLHVLVEYMAYKIYEFFNIRVPKVDLVINNGKIGLASSNVKGKTHSHSSLGKIAPNVGDGFYIDVLLANWDVAGTGSDAANIIVDDKGNAYRIDPGGALTFRAQGGRKGDAFSDEPGEHKTFLDPKMSQAAEVFRLANVKTSAKRIQSVNVLTFSKALTQINEYIVKTLKESNSISLNSWKSEYKTIKLKLIKRLKYLQNMIKSL